VKVKDRCRTCKGVGKIEIEPNGFTNTCEACNGTGRKIEERYCPECDGVMVKSDGGWVCYYGCQK
jgi:DnaJ-class molecular chaperone